MSPHDRNVIRVSAVVWRIWLVLLVPGMASCRAMRRLDDNTISCRNGSFSRLGSLPLSTERLAFWRSGGKHRPHHVLQASSSSSSSSSSFSRTVFPDNYHGLTLPITPTSSTADSVRPASRKVKRRRRGFTKQSASSSSTDLDVATAPTISSRKELAIQLSRPLIPQEAWDAATGMEFQDPELVEALAQSGLELCISQGDENPHVEWFPHSHTEKVLEEHDGNPMRAMEEDGNVLVYVGKVQKGGVVGGNLPLIKTQTILPLAAEEMAELLMDSSRVKIYNKMSLGRKDIRIFQRNTKIVRNLTQPPVANTKMVTVTLMHSRPLTEKDPLPVDSPYKRGYLVVSRAVPGVKMEEELADLPRNDILLGVNLLQEISPNECLMTAVTHVYSPALPTMLARSMGVKSAVDFIRDIRQSCEAALVPAN